MALKILKINRLHNQGGMTATFVEGGKPFRIARFRGKSKRLGINVEGRLDMVEFKIVNGERIARSTRTGEDYSYEGFFVDLSQDVLTLDQLKRSRMTAVEYVSLKKISLVKNGELTEHEFKKGILFPILDEPYSVHMGDAGIEGTLRLNTHEGIPELTLINSDLELSNMSIKIITHQRLKENQNKRAKRKSYFKSKRKAG